MSLSQGESQAGQLSHLLRRILTHPKLASTNWSRSLGVSADEISSWLAGSSLPSNAVLRRLMEMLRIDKTPYVTAFLEELEDILDPVAAVTPQVSKWSSNPS
jgi:hypothetical protein